MPIDCLNNSVPVYDPDEKGCYRWMSVKAGRPSKFCDDVKLEGDPPILETRGCVNACFDPPIPPLQARFRNVHPLAMTIDRTFTVQGTSNPDPGSLQGKKNWSGDGRSKFGEYLHYLIPEDNRFPDQPRAGFAFNHYLAQPVGGDVPGDDECIPFASYNADGAKMRDTDDVFPCIEIKLPGHYRMTSHLRFVQESYQPSITNGIGPAELLYTCSNYKNAPDKNAPIPEDHLTLWRNVRIVENVSANLLNIADRQLNYEFDVSPQLLAANGGTICLAFMIGFRDDGFPDPLNLPPRWLPRGALGSFTIHGLDEIDQDDTRVGPLNPKNDFQFSDAGIPPVPAPGIPLNEKNQCRLNGCNFILQWVSKYQEPTDNGIAGEPPADEAKPVFPTTYV